MPPDRRNAAGPLQSKYWCFTVNNPTVEPDAFADTLVEKGATYVVFGEETAPTTGTPHWQGYVEFGRMKRAPQVNKMVPGWHVESRLGTQQQAIDYCKGLSAGKTPNALVHEYGEPFEVSQGKRNDLVAAVATLKEGGIRAVAEEHPGTLVKYTRGMLFLDSVLRRRKPVPQVILCFGPSDSGKTRYFFDNAPEDDSWVMPVSDGLWFDGYFGEKWALIDEFDGRCNKVTLRVLLRVLDRYPVRVQVKGAFTPFTPEYIVITTNIHPRLWYDWTAREEQYTAMFRRFELVRWHKSQQEMVEVKKEDKEQWEHFWEHAPGVDKVYSW